MSKTTNPQPRFFVGKFKMKDGSFKYRVLRQRVTGRLIKKTIVEGYGDDWTAVKAKFARASKLFTYRAEARREKALYEGKKCA